MQRALGWCGAAGALLALLLWASKDALGAVAAQVRVSRATSRAQAARTALDPAALIVAAQISARHVPIPAAAPSGSEALAGSLRLQFRDRATRAPLPSLPAKQWVYGPACGELSGRQIDLELDANGGLELARADLLAATEITFWVTLPEVVRGFELHIRAPAELHAIPGPLTFDVDRGLARELRVVDEHDQALSGVEVWSPGEVHPVTTDGEGVARPVLPAPTPRELTFVGPGRRQIMSPVPPEGEPWVVVMPRANRLELVLAPGADPRSHHALVKLGPSFVQRNFLQGSPGLYDDTPGCPVEGTKGWWVRGPDSRSTWQLGFTAEGRAVLDHLDDHGQVEVELWGFEERLELRSVELPEGGGLTRVKLESYVPARTADLYVVDESGRPIAGARVRLGAQEGAWLPPDLGEGLPVWAPDLASDRGGLCRVPLPASSEVLVAAVAEGFALAVKSIGELAAAGWRLELRPAQSFTITVVDRDGLGMVEQACGNAASVEPLVRLPHGLWLTAFSMEWTVFQCCALPDAVAEVHFSHLDEVLLHDPRVPEVRFESRRSVDELRLGL